MAATTARMARPCRYLWRSLRLGAEALLPGTSGADSAVIAMTRAPRRECRQQVSLLSGTASQRWRCCSLLISRINARQFFQHRSSEGSRASGKGCVNAVPSACINTRSCSSSSPSSTALSLPTKLLIRLQSQR